ncbi:MAG: hypothetical protein ACM3S1_13950 [Hyphomicrobiales bacterium]
MPDDRKPTPAANDNPDEKARRFKSEDEMSQGAHHHLNRKEAQFEYDPSRHRASEEGGEP